MKENERGGGMNRFQLRFGLSCPFCGYGQRVAKIALVVSLAMSVFAAFRDWNIFTAFLVTFFLIILGGFLWCNRLSAHDRACIDAADYLLWMPITEPDRQQLVRNTSKISVGAVVYAAILLLIGLFDVMNEDNDHIIDLEGVSRRLPYIAVSAAVIGFLFVLTYMQDKLWRGVDDSAMCAEVPVSGYYSVEESRGKGATCITDYLIIYLPTGKYVLRQNVSGCRRIKLVRYQGMMTYIELV